MGKEIVYCGGCGKSLREEEFERGKAHTVDHRPYCVACKPLPAAPSEPRPPAGGPPLRQKPATARRAAPEKAPGSSRGLLFAGLGLAAAAVLLLVLFSGGKNPSPTSSDAVDGRPPSRPIDRPSAAPVAPDASLKELESLADLDALLRKCDELRASLKGTPHEPRFQAIERRALEVRAARDLEGTIERSIEQARKLVADERAVERREEVLRFLGSTREIAGERRGEVDRLLAEFQIKIKEADSAPPKPAPPAAPPALAVPLAVVSFTLINADTDLPIAGFDPIAAGATIDFAILGTRNLNVRANTNPPAVGSVRFELNGVLSKIEDVAPYALAGGVGANYNPWTPPAGAVRISATPFEKPKAAGAAGSPLALALQVVDATSTAEAALAFQDGVSPTPAYAGTRDTEISESQPAHTGGTARKLEADGDVDRSGRDRYVLVKWDLSSVPAGSPVGSAWVTFTVVGSGSKAPFTLHEIKREWGEKGACWTSYQIGKPWETPGARGAEDRGALIGTVLAPKLGPVTVPLDPAVVQSWIDHPASNQGFMMSSPDTSDALQVASREYATAMDRPRLSIRLKPPARKLHAETFDRDRGKFQSGEIVDGGVDGGKALGFNKAGTTIAGILDVPVSPTVALRVKVKPLFELRVFEVVMVSGTSKRKCGVSVRGLKKGEWNTVEFKIAEAREGADTKGPGLEGDTVESFKFSFEAGSPIPRVLIDDFEIVD